MTKLKDPRKERLAQARALGKTLEKCSVAAGYAGHAQSAHRMLKDVEVDARVNELQDQAVAKTEKTLEDIYVEMERVAFAKTPKLYRKGEDGLPEACMDDKAEAGAEMVVEEVVLQDGTRIGKKIKLRLHDNSKEKIRALIELAKLHSAMEERELARQALEANTIDGTVQDDEEDHLAFLAERYNLKSLDMVRAAKKSGDYSALTGHANGKTNGKAIDHTHQTDKQRRWAEEMGQRFSRKIEEQKQNGALGTSNGMANGKPNGNGSGSGS